jgi:hypothetical protein
MEQQFRAAGGLRPAVPPAIARLHQRAHAGNCMAQPRARRVRLTGVATFDQSGQLSERRAL